MGVVYCFPDVGRAGLGNLLFPWARAEVFRRRHGVRMLAPQWTRPKIGPLLRGEKDLRYYTGLFDHRGAKYVGGLAKYAVLATCAKIPAGEGEAFMASESRRRGRHVVVFRGWEGWFKGMEGERAFVRERLEAILSRPVKEILARSPKEYAIAAHVRRGDKPTMKFGEAFNGEYHQTMHDEWFVNAIRAVRRAAGVQAPVTVFSDARPEKIRMILDEPGVTISGDNPSIVDMFLLSRARALITTGTSSFSAWGSYLGGMPTLWYPGLGLPLVPERPEFALETDLSGGLDEAGSRVIGRAWAGAGGA